MVTRSIVGRFLILAVLVASLGVIAQAAIKITEQSHRRVAKADAAPAAAMASLTPTPADAATVGPSSGAPAAPIAPQAPANVASAQTADAAPVRVVYPGPLDDASVRTGKIADAVPVSPLAAPAPPPAAPRPTPSPAPAVAAAAPPTVTAAVPPPAPEPAPAPAPVVAPAPAPERPVHVASVNPNARSAPEAAPPPSSRGVNLNSASVEALNHIGGGRIGETIVKHRPYHSIEDLVRKRVVRRSVYEHIKNQVAAE